MLKGSIFAALILLLGNAFASHQLLVGRHPRERIIIPDSSLGGVKDTIQKAVDQLASVGGGLIHLSSGTYKIETNITNAVSLVSKSNITFEGEGAATKFVSSSNTGGAQAYFLIQNSTGIYFRNIRMAGNVLADSLSWANNTQVHRGILFSGAANAGITACEFYGFYTGAIAIQSGSKDIRITDNTFSSVANKLGGDYGAVGIESQSLHVSVESNKFYDLTHSMVSISDASNIIVNGNSATFNPASNYTMGVFGLDTVNECIISNNILLGLYNEGVVLKDGPARNIISNNFIRAKYAGISINLGTDACGYPLAQDNTITGNSITGVNGVRVVHGILVVRATNTNIVANKIGFSQNGITLQTCITNTSINANIIQDAYNNGIVSNGSTSVIGNLVSTTPVGINVGGGDGTITNVYSNRLDNISGSGVREPGSGSIYEDQNH